MNNELPDINLWELIMWCLRRRRLYKVSGESMLPVLEDGEYVLGNTRAYCRKRPQPGDLVVAIHPEHKSKIVKRVESVTEDNRYCLHSENSSIPESSDSRRFGNLDKESIVARVSCRIGVPG